MNDFNPKAEVQDSHLILDQGEWPNFHDAEVHRLNMWRGGVFSPDSDLSTALPCRYPVTGLIRKSAVATRSAS